MESPKVYVTYLDKTFMNDAGQTNKQYVYYVENLLIIALNMVTNSSASPIEYTKYSTLFVADAKIIIDIDNSGVSTVTIVNNSNEHLLSSFNADMFADLQQYGNKSKLILTYRFIRTENYFELPKFSSYSQEQFITNHNKIYASGSDVVIGYDGSTQTYGYLYMVDGNSTFTFDAENYNKTMYGGTIDVSLYGFEDLEGGIIQVPLNEYCTINENDITLNFFPVLSTNSPSKYTIIYASSHNITVCRTYIDGILPYNINGTNQVGQVPPPMTYGMDNVYIFEIIGNNRFTDEAPNIIMEAINDKFESYEVIRFSEDRKSFDVIVKRIKDNIHFEVPTTPSDVYVSQPTITFNLTDSYEIDETDFEYGKPYQVKIVPLGDNVMIDIQNMIITMGGESIKDEAISLNKDGSITINIDSVRGNVVVTVLTSIPQYKLTLKSTDLIEDELYSVDGVFDVELDVTQPINDTQANIIVKKDGVVIGNHVITIGANKRFDGFELDGKILILSNSHINYFDIKKYTETKELELLAIIVDSPTLTDFEITLYHLNGDKNIVDKTNVITEIQTLTGTLRESTTITNPVITFEFISLPTFNYVYIPLFNRYYYLKELTIENNRIGIMTLHVDVLMSFKNEIRSQKCMIARNEFDSNPMLIDVIRKSTNEKEIIYPKFTEDISDTWFNGFDPTLKDITLILQVMGKE